MRPFCRPTRSVRYRLTDRIWPSDSTRIEAIQTTSARSTRSASSYASIIPGAGAGNRFSITSPLARQLIFARCTTSQGSAASSPARVAARFAAGIEHNRAVWLTRARSNRAFPYFPEKWEQRSRSIDLQATAYLTFTPETFRSPPILQAGPFDFAMLSQTDNNRNRTVKTDYCDFELLSAACEIERPRCMRPWSGRQGRNFGRDCTSFRTSDLCL